MRSIIFIAFVLLSTSLCGQHNKPVKILFIGNSYTAANNLSDMLKEMATLAGDSVIQTTSAGGGQTLANHATAGSPSMNQIATGNYDVVVIQEQSQIPSFTDTDVNTLFFPYVRILDSAIKAANPCSRTVLYMTWGRKYGDAMNCASWPPVCTYTGMDSLLRKRYTEAAVANKCIVSPAGAVWRYIRQYYPEINLYEPDNSHPSFEGTYAVACTFYAALFKKSPSRFALNYHLTDSTVQKIKSAVDAVVLPQADTWQLNAYSTKAGFSHSLSGVYASFNNTSENATAYEWHFGDGDTAHLKHPVHAYMPGKYKITLIAKGCHGNDTSVSELNIAPQTSIRDYEQPSFIVYPVPAISEISIPNHPDVSRAVAVSNLGQAMELPIKTEGDKLVLDIRIMSAGLYALLLETTQGQTITVRFIKQ